jgi:hypothetical protein
MITAANPNLSSIDQVIVVWTNVAGATFACVAFWVASVKIKRYRATNVASALLATLYVVGYFVLLFTNVDQATWSTTLRWLGIASWPLVWAIPPLRLIRRVPVFDALVAKAAADGDA